MREAREPTLRRGQVRLVEPGSGTLQSVSWKTRIHSLAHSSEEVRGFLVSRSHRVCDALLEGQVPGLHVVSYSEGIVRLQEGLQGISPKRMFRCPTRGGLKTDPKCEGELTAVKRSGFSGQVER